MPCLVVFRKLMTRIFGRLSFFYLLLVKRAAQLFLLSVSFSWAVSSLLRRAEAVLLHERAYLSQDRTAPAPTRDAIDPAQPSCRPFLTCVCACCLRCSRRDRRARGTDLFSDPVLAGWDARSLSVRRSAQRAATAIGLLGLSRCSTLRAPPAWRSDGRSIPPEIGWALGPKRLAHKGSAL